MYSFNSMKKKLTQSLQVANSPWSREAYCIGSRNNSKTAVEVGKIVE